MDLKPLKSLSMAIPPFVAPAGTVYAFILTHENGKKSKI